MYQRSNCAIASSLMIAIATALSSLPSTAQQAPASVSVRTVASGLTSPIGVVSSHDKTGRLFIIDQIGVVRLLASDGSLKATPFLDLTGKVIRLRGGYDERGLLGLAFHPKFASNGRVFAFYSIPLRAGAPAGWDSTMRLSEFKAVKNADTIDLSTEKVLLEVDKPQFNHNGGTIAFGHDRNLYISIGDGGNKNDIGLGHTPALGNSQDLTKLLGKILRVDVDHAFPYSIPPNNPFVGTKNRQEIYAYGFRNPFRFSFDMEEEGKLLAGDSGQNLWEEIDDVKIGGNYGWHLKEGTHFFDPNNEKVSPATGASVGANGDRLIDPVIEYPNASNPIGGLGVVNIGGNIYRGERIAKLKGLYVFGDFSRGFVKPDGTLFVAKPRDEDDSDGDGHDDDKPKRSALWSFHELSISSSTDGRLHHFIKGFGQDDGGEIYVTVSDRLGPAGSTGLVLKLTP